MISKCEYLKVSIFCHTQVFRVSHILSVLFCSSFYDFLFLGNFAPTKVKSNWIFYSFSLGRSIIEFIHSDGITQLILKMFNE